MEQVTNVILEMDIILNEAIMFICKNKKKKRTCSEKLQIFRVVKITIFSKISDMFRKQETLIQQIEPTYN